MLWNSKMFKMWQCMWKTKHRQKEHSRPRIVTVPKVVQTRENVVMRCEWSRLFVLFFSPRLNTMQTKRHGNVYNLNGLNSSWLNIGILTSSWENQNFSKTMRFSIDNNLTIVSILQIRELKMDVKNKTKKKPNKQTVNSLILIIILYVYVVCVTNWWAYIQYIQIHFK